MEHAAVELIHMAWTTLHFGIYHKDASITKLTFVFTTIATFTTTTLPHFPKNALATINVTHTTRGTPGLLLDSLLRINTHPTFGSTTLYILERNKLPKLVALDSMCINIATLLSNMRTVVWRFLQSRRLGWIVGTGRNLWTRVPRVHFGPIDVTQRFRNRNVCFQNIGRFQIATYRYNIRGSDNYVILPGIWR